MCSTGWVVYDNSGLARGQHFIYTGLLNLDHVVLLLYVKGTFLDSLTRFILFLSTKVLPVTCIKCC